AAGSRHVAEPNNAPSVRSVSVLISHQHVKHLTTPCSPVWLQNERLVVMRRVSTTWNTIRNSASTSTCLICCTNRAHVHLPVYLPVYLSSLIELMYMPTCSLTVYLICDLVYQNPAYVAKAVILRYEADLSG